MATKTTLLQALAVLSPGAHWSTTDPYDYSKVTWLSTDITPPDAVTVATQQAYMDSQAPLNACKNQASALLTATDWVEIPSVTAVTSTPHLLNAADFITYRNALRALAVNPVANPVWPTKPTEQWSS